MSRRYLQWIPLLLLVFLSGCSALTNPDDRDCCTKPPVPEGIQVGPEGTAILASIPEPLRIYQIGEQNRDYTPEEVLTLGADPLLDGPLEGYSSGTIRGGRCTIESVSWRRDSVGVQFELLVNEAVLIDSGVLVCLGHDLYETIVAVTDAHVLQDKQWSYR